MCLIFDILNIYGNSDNEALLSSNKRRIDEFLPVSSILDTKL